ncbi:MAG: redox-regulated ATPase YchF [Acidobacteriota bacterium]|nr:redox-regulated ATPase YchF [Blastocatellia bacterium]MDW8413088.1 redox-regulated ATPase YchF [Acidobacteriota bacterium]
MKVGIVGFAGSGKTTVFNALTGLKAGVGGFKDKVNLGIIKVPDPRVDRLAEIYKTRRKVFAEITFVDFAGEFKKSGLDAKIVAEMRQLDALVQIVRAFENPMLEHPPQPLAEVESFLSELILADLIPIENRLSRMKKEKANPRERELIERVKEALDEGVPVRKLGLSCEESQLLSGFRLLTEKPMMLLLNVAENALLDPLPANLVEYAGINLLKLMAMCGKIEMEVAELAAEEQGEFLRSLGITEPARDRFIRAAYELLDLISFLTAGEDECRAWTIRRGTTAQRAAGKIHSDMERGFIRAEVIAYKDFVECGGSEARCKELGKYRLEGKDYVVADGDIINFRFNV